MNFMKKAILEARKAKGKTHPNPCVGAVIVKNNQIVAKGYHKKAGFPHAEVEAINDAQKKGIDLKDCTIYVTLEPCNHYGKTPPCTQAIINSKIKNVVIGCLDINPDVAGGGADFLRQNGVNVTTNIEENLCRELIEDFIVWKKYKRPYTTLKMATSLDGKIATKTGDASWISCEASRKDVHKMRKNSHAVIIGKNTFFNDNPKLTARINGADKQPKAVVVTSCLPNFNDDFYLIQKRAADTIFWTTKQEINSKNAAELLKLGCEIKNFENLETGMNWLFEEKNCHYLLCEGGGFLANELLKENLIDIFVQYLAPISLGDNNAKSLFSGNDINFIKDAHRWLIQKHSLSGSDLKIVLKPQKR
ncbi:MAG: bifunctional diaminohydroxyphosphoribosylaminopyrimidine deaminase/5-amino-6-(5-phosphoribosylamino)uracil reductase RibD [Alphaproteobacteria bacterium]